VTVLSADEDVRGADVQVVAGRGVFAPGFLFSLFRVTAWMAFFGGAAVTGSMVWFCESTGLDKWGWIATITAAFVGVFFTAISWAFLLLFARIADYIDHRLYYADGG